MSDQPIKVLLIEDNTADAFLITETLATVQDAAFDVERAERLSSGLERLAEGDIDVVLLDLSLLGSAGVGTFAKTHARTSQVPVIVLSGAGSEALAVRAVREGAQDYLVKGQVDGKLMARAIQYAIERKRAEEALQQRTYDLGKRVKELSCLYAISGLVERQGISQEISWEEILQEIVYLIPPAWQYPAVTCARIILDDEEFATENFRETAWKQASDVTVYGERIGAVEVYYLEEKPSSDEGPFLKEERNLIDVIAERLGRIIERRRAGEKLQYQANLFENVSDAIISSDLDFNIQGWNKAAEAIYGWQADEVIGKPIVSFTKLEYPYDQMEDVLEQFFAQGHWKGEAIQQRKDGTRLNISASVSLVRDSAGNPVGAVAVNRDITERKQVEQALQRRNRELAALSRAGRAIGSLLDLDQVLVTLLEEVRRLMGVTASSVWLLDPETGELVCRQVTGPSAETVRGWRLAPGEGIAGWTARSGESLVIRDVRADEHHFAGVDEQTGLSLRSILSTPLWTKQRVIGVLQVVDTEVGRFSEADLELLEPLAASAAVAIENAQLYEAVRRRNEELLILNTIAATVSQPLDLDHILRDVLDKVIQLNLPKGADRGVIFLLDEQTGELSPAAYRGFPRDHPCLARPPRVGECLCGLAARQGEVLVCGDRPQDERHSRSWPGMDSHQDVCLPLKARGRTVGVLALALPMGQAVTDSDVGLLMAVGDQVGVAIENARLAEEAAEVEILQEMNRLRSELIANVSHELRTPLGLIKVFCSSLLAKDVDFDQETQAKLLHGIDEESDRLEAIVSNLLSLSRVEAGRLHLSKRSTDVGQLAGRIVEATKEGIEPTQYQFVLDFPPDPLVATVDPGSIEQVLRNLLSNAVKYSPEGGTITIRGRSDGSQVLIEISDQGIGIPAVDFERVFERFYRVENEVTQRVSGAGLGLSVCQGIVEAHGGRIWVESEPGKGSTFHLTLPVEEGE